MIAKAELSNLQAVGVLITCLAAGFALRSIRPLLLRPLWNYFRHRTPGKLTIRSIEAHDRPGPAIDYLTRESPYLQAAGFEPAAVLESRGPTSIIRTTMAVFVQRASATFVIVSYVERAAGSFDAIELVTETPDGRAASTSSIPVWDFVPHDPKREAINFARWQRLPILLEIHRRRLARWPAASEAKLPFEPGGEAAFLQRDWMLDCEHRRSAGWIKPRSDTYRLTLKGAFLTAWRSGRMHRLRLQRERDRLAQTAWDSLSMDDYIVPPSPAAAPVPAIVIADKE